MSEDTRNSIQLVHSATEDLLRILNDILDATKLGAAKMALVNYDFDLHELAVDRCYVLSTLCADKGLEMVLDFPRTVPSKFRGDAGRIRQVMSNLITNAVKVRFGMELFFFFLFFLFVCSVSVTRLGGINSTNRGSLGTREQGPLHTKSSNILDQFRFLYY